MPRKNRLWREGSILHITVRGNRKEDIFKSQEDYCVYLRNLQHSIKFYNNEFQILSYCLMTNHIHLQIETKSVHIKKLMGKINTFYAKYFNNKYDYHGHLFQGRYGSRIIDSDSYILEVSRYISLNPVRANIVDKPEDYKWSSYPMLIGKKKEKLINSDRILSYFIQSKKRELYRMYVEDAMR
ncbi:transposase IS200 like protein [Clostridium ragsdalei P11]|uniref:Transposase IS200 like protein n=1 Tax=Clostridium ragsdalei P11 TaxID=1353534 RepID=A0A1A6AIG9_9CLOT|nr:transposase [Clostridium ragsdalei]OBR89846.1 transposase IS200 like protein [Clostridium ragsdalei P11]